MIEQLPCASCTALCCGPVDISPERLKLIREYLQDMPRHEQKRLARQDRGGLDCRFLDKETYRCTIYPVRPWVCQAFGRTEGLGCPVVGHLVQILPHIMVDHYASTEIHSGVVGITNRWNWRKLDFD